MLEIFLDNIANILGISVIIGGAIFGTIRYKNKKLRESLNIDNRVTNLEDDFIEEKKEADAHHNRMYNELSSQGKDISFIRGKIAKL